MSRRHLLPAAILAACAASHPALAQSTTDCQGGQARITGDGADIHVHGACHSLLVEGNANRIDAELAPGARVDVTGNHNKVRWRLIGGTGAAKVTITGTDDLVGAGDAPLAGLAAGATRPPLDLSAGTQADCQDRDVHISGDGGAYTLKGGCRSIHIDGTGNTVHAELQPQAGIAPGHANRVYWFMSRNGAPPQVTDPGTDSQVLQEQRLGSTVLPASETPPPDGALMLTGERPLTDADCHGRDVQITADNSRFVLHGQCRTITVAGNHDTVEAEMMAGSRIRINGDHTVVQFVLVTTGPDPIVSAEGDGSSAYRIQRLGAGSRAAASQGVAPTPGGMQVTGGRGASVTEMPPAPESLPH